MLLYFTLGFIHAFLTRWRIMEHMKDYIYPVNTYWWFFFCTIIGWLIFFFLELKSLIGHFFVCGFRWCVLKDFFCWI